MTPVPHESSHEPLQVPFLEEEKVFLLDSDEPSSQSNIRCANCMVLKRSLLFHWIAIGALVSAVGVYLVWILTSPSRPLTINQVYSPAQNIVRYKNVVFTTGFHEGKTKYMGPPTPQSQKAWEDLYDFGISKISFAAASQLWNKTEPIPGSPGDYVIGLDVFHQLHCLHALRTKVWTGSTNVDTGHHHHHDMDHLDHCIDSIRQSLMCSSDISPITWKWVEKDKMAKPDAATIHTCRDFEALKEWGKRNQAPRFNRTIRVPNPLD